MRLLEDTKTNLNRDNITNPTNAKYRADKLYTELIFNKHDPNETIQSISNTFYYKNVITYTVNSVTYPDSFDNNLNVVCSNGIHFFKSIERALLWDLDLFDTSYTGDYATYYDGGQIERRCNYINSRKCGEYINYYENGQIAVKCNYVDREICDEYIRYFDNGLKCGEYIEYYIDGKIKIKCNYSDGKLCGEYFIL